jgi:hypothetical protein
LLDAPRQLRERADVSVPFAHDVELSARLA